MANANANANANAGIGKELLLDIWEADGNSLDEMYRITEELDACTKVIEMPLSQIGLFTLKEVTDTSVNGWEHHGNSVIRSYPLDRMTAEAGATPELIAELDRNSKMMFVFNGHPFFTTSEVMRTLSQRAGSAYSDIDRREEAEMRFARNWRYTLYMNLPDIRDKRCHVIYRQVDNAKKVIAVLTDRHAPIPQTESIRNTISGFEKDLGKTDLKWYRINATETVLYAEYPDKKDDFSMVAKENGMVKLPDEVIPGIQIRTADGGDSSFTVIGTMRVGTHILYVPAARFARAHTKNADLSDIDEKLRKKVFVEFTKIPERLCELLAIDIADPKAAVYQVAESKLLGIKSVLGLGTKNEVIENIIGSLNPAIQYTAYDIAMMFADEAARLENEKSRDETIGKIRNCFVQAIFFRYEDL